MADVTVPRLRLTNRSVVLAVAMLGVTLAAMRMFSASSRVLGWLAVAAIVAALLHPLVERLNQRLPRGLAVAGIVLATLITIGGIVYAGYGDVQRQAQRLQEVAPDAAERIEDSERFGDAAGEFELKERVEDFVDQLPERLRGGDAPAALRSAATRGVAYLATGVLTIFLLIHGRRLVNSGLAQVSDPQRRERMAGLLAGAHRRASTYLALTAARVVVAGVFTWAVARFADLPGATLLAITVSVTALVPLVGVLVGAIPVLLLAGAFSPDLTPVVAGLFVAYQGAEVLLVERRLESASVHVGPVLTLIAGMAGLELYGLGGMLVAVVGVVFLAALAKELAPRDDDELLAAADAVLPGDELTTP